MKHIRSALIAGLVTFGGAAVASAQQATPAPAPGAHAHHGHFRRGEGFQHQLFRGITLSDAEKANIKAVREKYAPQMKGLREQLKPQLQAAREARQRGDTAALKTMWAQSAAQREQVKKLLEAERTDLRAALVPANQAKFDANVKELEQRIAQRAGRWKNGGGHTEGRQGPRV